jgi:hypothetical protein
VNGSDPFTMPAELGDSIHHILNALEDLGLDEFPSEIEEDLRRALRLPAAPHAANPSLFSSSDRDDHDQDYDLGENDLLFLADDSIVQQPDRDTVTATLLHVGLLPFSETSGILHSYREEQKNLLYGSDFMFLFVPSCSIFNVLIHI